MSRTTRLRLTTVVLSLVGAGLVARAGAPPRAAEVPQEPSDALGGFAAKKRQLDKLNRPAQAPAPARPSQPEPSIRPAGPQVAPAPLIQPQQPGGAAAPLIRPPAPGRPPRVLIPITPGAKRVSSAPAPHDPERYWSNYYRDHDESSGQLKETVALLNRERKFRDVQAALSAYLRLRNKNQEPWMYEALALAVKMNKGPEELAKRYLSYAADSALKTQNPNHLVSVADQMMLRGELDRVGVLLDEAAQKVPHRAEPLIMSINLAQKTKDPKRMGDSVERLFALGWPGSDDQVRLEARQQVETLAKALREDNRDAEAQALLARLPRAEERDLYIRLSWSGPAVLDLSVTEPRGTTAGYRSPRTAGGGSIVKNSYGTKSSEEVYVCPRAFDGPYTVKVDTIANSEEKPVTQATLEIITHEGGSAEHKETRTIALGKSPATSVVTLTGGRRTAELPLPAPPLLALPIPKPAAAGGRVGPAAPAQTGATPRPQPR